MSIFGALAASKKPEPPSLGKGSGPLGLELDKDKEITFLEKTGLITPKDAQRRREDLKAKYKPGTATQKRKQKASIEQKRRAEDTGTPITSLTQLRKENPKSWESRVVTSRKRLGIAEGSEDDALLKSALWMYSLDESGKGVNIVDDASLKAVTELMRTPEGRADIANRVNAYREAMSGLKDKPKLDQTPEQEVTRRNTEMALRESGAQQMIDSVQGVKDQVNNIPGVQFTAGLATGLYGVAGGDVIDRVTGLDTKGIVGEVAKDAAGQFVTTPARVFTNLFKLVTPGEVEGAQRAYAAGELVMDFAGIIGMAPGGLEVLTSGGKGAIKAFFRSDDVVKAVAKEVGGVENAERVLKQAAESIDDVPEEAIDDAITKFQQSLDQDVPNPDVPGAIDVNALPKDPQVDELPGVQFRQPEETPGVTFREPQAPKNPPVEDVPKVKPEAPKALPKEKPKATGLANQVQDRETLDGIIKEVEKTKGKSAEDWQKAGKAKVDDGADFEALAKRVGEGEEELTGEAVGILTEGKRLLLNDVNRKADALKADPKNFRLQKDLADAEERLQDYVQNVQAGKGRWSDVGRALQSGTTVDEGNFADIIQRAERTGNKLSDKQKAEVSKWADEVKKRDEQITKLEADLASAKQSGGAQDVVSRARSGPRIKKEVLRKNIESNLEALRKARAKSGVGGRKTRGAAAPLITKEEALLIKEIALDYARLGTATLEDVVKAVKQAIKDTLGVEYADQDIIDAIAEQGEKRTRSELAARVAELRRQAKSQSTGTKAEIAARNEILRLRKIDKAKAAALEAKSKREFGEMWRYQDRVLKYEEEIARLQNEIKEGRFLKPSKKISQVDENLQRLRAERDVYASKVKSLIRQNEQSKLLRRVREGAGAIRSSILGSDIGILTRQGLFSWANPKIAIKATKGAVKSAFSEVEAAKAMRLINERRIDGKLAAVARKKAGLSLTDFASNPEELSATLLIKKLPIIGETIGGSLERFQHVFINQVRADTFDRALKLGYSADELKARARFINNATGRGNIKNVPAALEAVMTSPRYEASRWGLIAEPARNLAGIARKDGKWALNRGARDNIKDMAVTAAEIYGLFKVAELAGYETNLTDSTSSDFLKLRKGDEVWDVSAGLAPRIVDIMRLVAYVQEPGYNKDIGALIDRAGTRTISPAVRTPLTFLSVQDQKSKGKSFTAEKDGDKVKSPFSGFTVEESEAGWLAFTPLIFQSFLKTLEEEGMGEASWAALREFIGQSVNRYPRPK